MQVWHGIRIFLVNPWCSQVELDIERSKINWTTISWLHTFQSFTELIIGSWKSQQVLAVIHLSIPKCSQNFSHLQEPPGRNILDISSSFSQQAFPSVSQFLRSPRISRNWGGLLRTSFIFFWLMDQLMDLHDFYVGITWNHMESPFFLIRCMILCVFFSRIEWLLYRKNISLFCALDPPNNVCESIKTDQGTPSSPWVHPSQRHTVSKAHAGLRGVRRRQEHFGFAQAKMESLWVWTTNQQVMVSLASTMVLWWCRMCIFSSPTGLGWFGYINGCFGCVIFGSKL